MEAENILKNVPAIILTASNDPRTKLKSLELGATEFLNKPVDPTELVMRIRNTIAAKAFWQGCWEPAELVAEPPVRARRIA
jgi:DNA-binding response OmpR family regulator